MIDPRYPFGPADVQNIASAATVALSITNGGLTYVRFTQLTAAMALTCTVSSDIKAGALLFVEIPSDATARTVTPGAGFTSAALAGTISKTKVASFVYDGSTFINTGFNQIN